MNTYNRGVIKVLMKSMYLGLVLNTLGPIGLIIAIVYIRGDSFDLQGGITLPDAPNLMFVLLVFAAISIMDLIMTYVLKNKMVAASVCPPGQDKQAYFDKRVMTISILIFALNASHTIYGLILYFLGMPLEIMMLFVALTLIGYQVFRPRPKFLQEFYNKIVGT